MNQFQLGRVLLAIAAVLTASAVHALQPDTPFEYWKDLCGYPNVIPSPYKITGGPIPRLMSAEAWLIPANEIERRSDNPNFYRLNTTAPNQYYLNTQIPIGGDTPFQGETQMSDGGRTGYLVAPNIIVTAAHTYDFDPSNYKIVFDLHATQDPNSSNCIPPDTEHIPAANVYAPAAPTQARPSPLIINTLSYFDNLYGNIFIHNDYAAFYLEGSVTNRQYLRLRASGTPADSDHFAMVGHPSRLRTKLIYGQEFTGLYQNPNHTAWSVPLFDDYYVLDGMSGAPLYNLDRSYVETSVGTIFGQGCAYPFLPNSTIPPEPYYNIIDMCTAPYSETLLPGFNKPEFHVINLGPISTLADLVPTLYAKVQPLDDVTYVLPVGGTAAPAQTDYTVTASNAETGNTSIAALVAPSSVPGQPNFLQFGSFNSSLVPGGSTTIAATANVPLGTPCGVYDRRLVIKDQTHGFQDGMLHHFEVGMTAFDVSPTVDQDIYGIAVPSYPQAITFTLTNTRPTPTVVNVVTDKTWALLFPQPGYALSAAGQNGSTQTVSLLIDDSAFGVANGDYPITLTFSDTSNCALNPPQQRIVTFHKGELVLEQELGVSVPIPTPPLSPVTATISVVEPFCISDVSVGLDNQSVGSVLGEPLAMWVPHLAFNLDYSGTSSGTISLWNHQAIPSGWAIPSYEDEALGALEETLLLNNISNLPPTGALLSQFAHHQAQGNWTIRIVDDGLSPYRNEVTLARWRLEFHGSGRCGP